MPTNPHVLGRALTFVCDKPQKTYLVSRELLKTLGALVHLERNLAAVPDILAKPYSREVPCPEFALHLVAPAEFSAAADRMEAVLAQLCLVICANGGD